MKTRLIKIGNSQGVLINKSFIQHYQFGTEVEIEPHSDGLLIKPAQSIPRQDWNEQFQAALAAGELPDEELLEGFSNDFENEDWTW